MILARRRGSALMKMDVPRYIHNAIDAREEAERGRFIGSESRAPARELKVGGT